MNFFSAFLEMFRNSDQFIAHMSAEYGIYVYLFLFTVYFLETGIVICALRSEERREGKSVCESVDLGGGGGIK